MRVEIRFTRSARKHRIGKARAMRVISSVEPTLVPPAEKYDEQWVWTGEDDRGVELHIVGVERPDCMLIIHVQPTSFEHQDTGDDGDDDDE